MIEKDKNIKILTPSQYSIQIQKLSPLEEEKESM